MTWIKSENTHVHRYKRVKLGKGGYTVFKCMIPQCAHYIRKELAIGRETVCWVCGQAMVLTSRAATLVKPHHFECTKERVV